MNNYIVLVNYNNYHDTIACVETIRRQQNSNNTVVIVDNASTNDSADIIGEKCPDCIIIKNNKNAGFSAANNIGARIALSHGAETITFLNNDTLLRDDFFEKLLSGMRYMECICPVMLYESDRDIVNFAGGFFDYKKGCGTLTTRGMRYSDMALPQERFEIDLAQGCCIAMTSDTYKLLGPWREDYFLYREDDEYTLRMKSKGINIYLEPRAILYHKENASTGKERGNAFRNYYLLRNRLYNIALYRIGFFTLLRTIIAAILKYTLCFIRRGDEYKYNIKAVLDFINNIKGPMTIIREE